MKNKILLAGLFLLVVVGIHLCSDLSTYEIVPPIAQEDPTNSAGNGGQAGETNTANQSNVNETVECVLETPIECDLSINSCSNNSQDCE